MQTLGILFLLKSMKKYLVKLTTEGNAQCLQILRLASVHLFYTSNSCGSRVAGEIAAGSVGTLDWHILPLVDL